MKNKQYDILFKFVIVGNSAVGKSSILRRFADNQFVENYMTTIGVDFRFKSLTVAEKIIKLQIWDTAGQQRFRTVVSTYYKGSHAVFMVFDLTNQNSFDDATNYWINQIESFTSAGVCIILVGNKCDHSEKTVNEADIKNFAQQKSIDYFQISAKTGFNVFEMFNSVAEKLVVGGNVGKVPTAQVIKQNCAKNQISKKENCC